MCIDYILEIHSALYFNAKIERAKADYVIGKIYFEIVKWKIFDFAKNKRISPKWGIFYFRRGYLMGIFF